MREKKFFTLIGDVIFYSILAMLIFVCIIMVQARKRGEQPTILGHKFYIVLTGSMSPTINAGDLIIVKEMNPSDIKAQDIITFSSSTSGNITTHRVKEVLNDNRIQFITQGDANNIQDPNPIDKDMLIGKVIKSVPKIGAIMGYMKDNMVISIIGILLIILLFSGISFGINKLLNRYKKLKGFTDKEIKNIKIDSLEINIEEKEVK